MSDEQQAGAGGGRFCRQCGAAVNAGSRFCSQCGAAQRDQSPVGYDGLGAFLSIGCGLFLLLLMPRMLQWVSSRLFGTHFNEFMLNNQVVPYPQVPEFWADLGPTLFGVVLVFSGAILWLVRRRAVLAGVMMLTALVTLYNLGYVIASFGRYGLAPVSALVFLAGALMMAHQWGMLRGRA
jgi:hypothetical protein